MNPTRVPFVVALLLVVPVLALTLLGCSKKKITAPEENPTDLLAQANQELEAVLNALINSPGPQRPADVNFSGPLAKYEQVLAGDPNNPTANFGAGVLHLLSLSYDAEVNAAFDEWKAYLQNHVPFETGSSGPLQPLGIPTTFRAGSDAYRLPFAVVPLTLVAPARATRVATDPQISRVQAILRDRVLPRLAVTIARLGKTAAIADFRFIVTPGMQGDPNASPVEIDQTDILALKAAAELLAAACHVAVAYDLGFASYDSTGLVNALKPGGNWLKLNSGGATNMLGAQAELLASLDDVGASLAALQAESDPQDDDFIKLGPEGVTQANVDSILSRLGQVRQALTSGYTLVADWDGNPATPETPLTIGVNRLFTQPVQDWKALLPPYTAEAVRRSFDVQFYYDSGTSSQTVNIPAPDYYYGAYSISDSLGQRQDYFYGSDSLRAYLRIVAEEQYQRIISNPGFNGDFYGVASFYGNLLAGPQTIPVYWYAYYTLAATQVFVPEIIWNADTYAQWTWPEPVLDGLFLPEVGTTSQLLNTFGYDPASWTKNLVLDWTGAGVAGLGSSPPRPPPVL